MKYETMSNEEIAKDLIKTYDYLSEMPNKLKDDKGVMLELVKQDKRMGLSYASNRLKDDTDVVLEAVKQDSFALQWASERLKDDKDVVLEAIKINSGDFGYRLEYASEKLKDDKEVILEAMKNNGCVLKAASKRLQNDKELLELLEKVDYDEIYFHEQKWYDERIEALANIRRQEEKELMEKSIILSNVNRKIKDIKIYSILIKTISTY